MTAPSSLWQELPIYAAALQPVLELWNIPLDMRPFQEQNLPLPGLRNDRADRVNADLSPAQYRLQIEQLTTEEQASDLLQRLADEQLRASLINEAALHQQRHAQLEVRSARFLDYPNIDEQLHLSFPLTVGERKVRLVKDWFGDMTRQRATLLTQDTQSGRHELHIGITDNLLPALEQAAEAVQFEPKNGQTLRIDKTQKSSRPKDFMGASLTLEPDIDIRLAQRWLLWHGIHSEAVSPREVKFPAKYFGEVTERAIKQGFVHPRTAREQHTTQADSGLLVVTGATLGQLGDSLPPLPGLYS